jgi:hypothetical protein
MNFNVVSKNNMGIVITLILVILLSQSRFFDFLIDTHLGRVILLAFVILTAYTHKILGLVSVLLIIISFNHHKVNMVHSYNFYGSNLSLFEGFDGSGNSLMVPSGEEAKDKLKDQVSSKINNIKDNSQTTTTTSSAVSGNHNETFRGREGFNMEDRETNILRGKPSNSVPVPVNLREQTEDVSPTDKSVFTSDYASF